MNMYVEVKIQHHELSSSVLDEMNGPPSYSGHWPNLKQIILGHDNTKDF